MTEVRGVPSSVPKRNSGATTNHTVNGDRLVAERSSLQGRAFSVDRLSAANAVRARQAAERAALEACRRLRQLDQRWLDAVAECVTVEQQRRAQHRAGTAVTAVRTAVPNTPVAAVTATTAVTAADGAR